MGKIQGPFLYPLRSTSTGITSRGGGVTATNRHSDNLSHSFFLIDSIQSRPVIIAAPPSRPLFAIKRGLMYAFQETCSVGLPNAAYAINTFSSACRRSTKASKQRNQSGNQQRSSVRFSIMCTSQRCYLLILLLV